MNHGSLFSGIGGFDLAADWLGWENVFQVEIEEFCLKVLGKNFPKVKRYKDIKEFDGNEYAGKIDVISGGFPCQPFSVAGKRKGKADDRFLWGEMLRVISEVKPSWCLVENVHGIININAGLVFEQVQTDLEDIGYEVQPFVIPACAQNAPHRRDRVWIVAYNAENSILYGNGRRDYGNTGERERTLQTAGPDCHAADVKSRGTRRDDTKREQIRETSSRERFTNNNWEWDWLEVATRLCRVDDGVPDRIHRLKSLGNAIVPQIAYEIFKIIDLIEKAKL
jgi:DNA (cytosine-5)-methyltransferase 1